VIRQRAIRWRAAKIGGAALTGGAVLFITGGLAAPAVATAVAGAGFTGAAAVALTSTAALAALFGVAGAGRAGYLSQD
jgi:hypothetical protein